jgi:two-component system, LytTR family, sensor kinase
MAKIFGQKRTIGGVKIGWIAVVLGFYFFNYLTYLITLTVSQLDYQKQAFSQLMFDYAVGIGINYALKLLLSIPVCYLYFKTLKHWRLSNKIFLHVFTLILYVLTWKKLFYRAMEFTGSGHLEGASEVWDLYIPALLYAIQFSLFHAFEYYNQWQEQKETAHQLSQISLQNELSAIKAQLNPHFLYNVFNTISASVPPEQERTRELIADLSDLFRYQLRASRTELVPLREEIEFVEKYLDLEKARFAERLSVKTQISEGVLSELVPSMMLQPLVENCLKHGLASLIEGGEVSISIKRDGDSIRFEIVDTGVGVKNKDILLKSEGIGLKNTQLRLEKLYDSSLNFSDTLPHGLTINFTIKTTLGRGIINEKRKI